VITPVCRSFTAIALFGFRFLNGLHRHGFDVAVGARLAIDQDFELRGRRVLHCIKVLREWNRQKKLAGRRVWFL
jgi:hypothetical protein